MSSGNTSLELAPETVTLRGSAGANGLFLTLTSIQRREFNNGVTSYDFLDTGNVKTINGESIYGSGDITISGGGKTYYRHSIIIQPEIWASTINNVYIRFDIIDTRSTAYTDISQLISAHPNYETVCMGGHYKDGSDTTIDKEANYMKFPSSTSGNFQFYANMTADAVAFTLPGSNSSYQEITDNFKAL
ncbi:MAG TPA: hypothetical protein DHU75_02960 [Rikenellaceae bacterium]|nr:hypothetical protein [Rikenellaceae bacterium]